MMMYFIIEKNDAQPFEKVDNHFPLQNTSPKFEMSTLCRPEWVPLTKKLRSTGHETLYKAKLFSL